MYFELRHYLLPLMALMFSVRALTADETGPRNSSDSPTAVTAVLDWREISFEIPDGAQPDPELLPRELQKLHDRRVRVTGYMMPTFRSDGITAFVLQRSSQMKFGAGLPVDEVMLVEMTMMKTVAFSTRQVVVEGNLILNNWILSEGGKTIAVYRLTADTCEPVGR